MRVIIAGSREISDPLDAVGRAVGHVLQAGWKVTEVVSGTARGVDQAGEAWALLAAVRVKRFPADWKKHGRSAGYRRNEEMARNADALLAVWDGQSRGTKHMIDIATKQGLKVHVYRADQRAKNRVTQEDA